MEDKNSKGVAANGKQPGGKIDISAIRELMQLMGQNDMIELEYEVGDLAVRLSKRQAAVPMMSAVAMPAGPALAAAAPVAAAPAAKAEDSYLKIVSPMVGTSYLAPTPDAPPFVAVGTMVNEETVVCLIEAMKVFNEIKSGVSGKVVKVGIKNEGAVEFGQVLFLVEPV